MSAPDYVLRASLPRRVFGTAVLAALGLLLLWMALTAAPALPWRALLVALGLVVLWLAQGLWRSTAGHIALTEVGLVDQTGRVLARIEDVAGIDRGTFAFKPSNGVLVKLKATAEPGWAPGLWWRYRRSLGIGGVTASADSKLLAEFLTLRLARTD